MFKTASSSQGVRTAQKMIEIFPSKLHDRYLLVLVLKLAAKSSTLLLELSCYTLAPQKHLAIFDALGYRPVSFVN